MASSAFLFNVKGKDMVLHIPAEISSVGIIKECVTGKNFMIRSVTLLMVCAIFILVAQVSPTSANSNLFIPYVTIPFAAFPEAIAIGDVNSDGRNDVVMTTSFSGRNPDNDFKLFVFLQNAAGQLDPPIKYAESGIYTNVPATVAIGDVNNDGKADVVVGNAGLNIEVFLQNSSGGLDPSLKYATVDSDQIRIGDFNNDGLLDVVGISEATQTASVFLQSSGGALNSPEIYSVTHAGPVYLDAGDVNGDGLSDIVVGGYLYANQALCVLTQTADGTFNSAAYYELEGDLEGFIYRNGFAVGDVDGDDAEDVVVTYRTVSPVARIGVFLQNAGGTLNAPLSYNAYCCTFFFNDSVPVEIADVNKDGRKDILLAHPKWLGVYLQNEGGTLEPEELYPLPSTPDYYFNPQGLAVGDINGDGTNDIVITINNPTTSGPLQELAVLYNQEGGAIPQISVSPSSIDFGSMFVGDTSSETVSIANTGTGNLLVNTITLSGVAGDHYGIQNDNCSGMTLEPAGSCSLEVIFSPTSTAAKTATLRIPSNDLRFPAIEVPLNGMAAVHAEDYLPLKPGTIWKYLRNGKRTVTRTVLNKEVTVKGVKTRPVKFIEENVTEYLTNGQNGINLHRQYQPNVYIGGVGWVDVDVTFIPPVKLAEGVIWIGQSSFSNGTAKTVVWPMGDTYYLYYEAYSSIEAEESITVPSGTFDAIRYQGSIILSGPTTQSLSTMRYLAKGIGIVKEVATDPQRVVSTFELVSLTHLALLGPNGGEIIHSGGTFDITWESSPNMTTFQLHYSLDDGATWSPIPGGTHVKDNHYLWTVPIPINNKKSCRIKVSGYNAANELLETDVSEKPFTIEVVQVTSPNGDEVWTSGELRSITWTTNETIDPVTKVKLSYTKNNGVTWLPITTITGSNPGTYDWTVPPLTMTKTNCKVKAVLKNSTGKSVGSDVSDQVFTIQPPP